MREESQRRWRLSYVFQDDHRILALVELTKNVRLTVQKVPYASENADKMLYITDADKILSFAGTIKSSRSTNRVFIFTLVWFREKSMWEIRQNFRIE